MADSADEATLIVAEVEHAAATLGLRCVQVGPLRTRPGSVHWHFKRDRQPGTLEVTYLPAEGRLSIHVRAGREGRWTTEAHQAFRQLVRTTVALAE